VNRLLYACFYAVSALLVGHGLSSSKHAGVRCLFTKQYVKTGRISKDLARVYNDLFAKGKKRGDRGNAQTGKVVTWDIPFNGLSPVMRNYYRGLVSP
jgi:uncharacterized protein (UPF0332 family)